MVPQHNPLGRKLWKKKSQLWERGAQNKRGPWEKFVHPLAFRKVNGRDVELSVHPKHFFPGKGHTGNSLSDQFKYSVNLIVREFRGQLRSHSLPLRPVLFHLIPFSKAFHVLEDHSWVSIAFFSEPVLGLLPPLKSLVPPH